MRTGSPSSGVRMAGGAVAGALLCGWIAQSEPAWPLAFVALVPWILAQRTSPSWGATLLGAWAMSVAYSAAVFSWFGLAIGDYTGVGAASGLAILLVAAPAFQPQFFAWAVARRFAASRHGPVLQALVAAAAWLATEAFVPRLLGDTLGQGLQPARWLRQAAAVGGTAGLTAILLLANEAVAFAIARRRSGARAIAVPLLAGLALPVMASIYGAAALSATPPAGAKTLRLGLVQSNIVDYERQRRERGAGAVVREILDTHFAMSYDAVERRHADAVLWSETVYPTTFGHPKSEAGAELDREILDIVKAAGVPFVFGTYDRDPAGEYNAAAFVEPGAGLIGFYRKTRLFPLTEYLPPWLDRPWLRDRLPWTGGWQPGNGARVFPLRLKDGREVPVVPLICLDDVDASLAIDGARLGGRAILTMSNDSWFTDHDQGARLHQAVASFRSVETGLPQFRVTSNGFSAVISPAGDILAGTHMGERTLVMGEVPVTAPARTPMVRWGDWVGRAAAVFLAVFVLGSLLRRLGWSPLAEPLPRPPALPAEVSALPPAARAAVGALQAVARMAMLGMAAAIVFSDGGLQTNTLAQIRIFAAAVLAPEAAAWLVLLAFRATASVEGADLVLRRGARRLAIPLSDIVELQPWRLPLPGSGLTLVLEGTRGGAAGVEPGGGRSRLGLRHPDPAGLVAALSQAGAATALASSTRASAYALARGTVRRGRLDHPLLKFGAFPLLLAIPAFRLHQHIAYGSGLGEYYTFGLKAYLTTFALWWAAWAIGVVLVAAALRAAIEAGTLAAVLVRPARAGAARRALEVLGRVLLFAGLPAWLLMRALGS